MKHNNDRRISRITEPSIHALMSFSKLSTVMEFCSKCTHLLSFEPVESFSKLIHTGKQTLSTMRSEYFFFEEKSDTQILYTKNLSIKSLVVSSLIIEHLLNTLQFHQNLSNNWFSWVTILELYGWVSPELYRKNAQLLKTQLLRISLGFWTFSKYILVI